MLRNKLRRFAARLLFFKKHCLDLIHKMGSKKGRMNVRKTEVVMDTPT